MANAAAHKGRAFKKFQYRGVALDNLLDMEMSELVHLFNSRVRRKFARGLNKGANNLIRKLRIAKKAAPEGTRPACVRTHLRNMIVLPEMIGSVIGIYNGKTFNQVEIRPDMVGHYLGELSITYKPVTHGRAGIAASMGAKFIPLK